MKLKSYIFVFLCLFGCSEIQTSKNVGDIPFDASIDNANFVVCNPSKIKQYYVRRSSDQTPIYRGEKIALEKTIHGLYKFPVTMGQNGYLTIRFIVNCKGETGRFRMEEMNFNYEAIQFDSNISTQLLSIVKQLEGWGTRKNEYVSFDYYQYLTFKIREGQIMTILP